VEGETLNSSARSYMVTSFFVFIGYSISRGLGSGLFVFAHINIELVVANIHLLLTGKSNILNNFHATDCVKIINILP